MFGRVGYPLKAAVLTLIGIGVLFLAVPLPAAHGEDRLSGIWANPQNSVHIRLEPCGESVCGVVVWANDKAAADAARGGTPRLIGEGLFRDFTRAGDNLWRGVVFVPDLGRTFSGTIRLLDDDRLEARGCLTRRLGCRTQVWTRLS